MIQQNCPNNETDSKRSIMQQLTFTTAHRPLPQSAKPLTWDQRCAQVELQLIKPLTDEIHQRHRNLYNLVRILNYARRRGYRPTLTDTVADLRDPSMKRDEFRALARRVLDMLDVSYLVLARRRDTSLPAPAANPTAPVASPPGLPGPSPAQAAPQQPAPAHASAIPSVLSPAHPAPALPARLLPFSLALERLDRTLGKPDRVEPVAPIPQ